MALVDWIVTPSCMEFNNYILGIAAAAIVGNIFWFFKWCAAKGELNELLATYGAYTSDG